MFICIKSDNIIKIRKREIKLKQGYYIYVGSAFGSGGLTSRLHRHLRKLKKQHWHIDQITMLKNSEIEGIAVSIGKKIECEIASFLSKTSGILPIRGVGNSDCTICPSHFFFLLE